MALSVREFLAKEKAKTKLQLFYRRPTAITFLKQIFFPEIEI